MNKTLMHVCLLSLIPGWAVMGGSAFAGDPQKKVLITPELGSITVKHNGKQVVIQRNQNPGNRITEKMTLTSRACPPHCVQPIKIRGVETVGELEVLNFLRRISAGDNSILVIDTRSQDFVAEGTIPGSINIFGDQLIEERGANPITIEVIFTNRFGVAGQPDAWDFGRAKTLVLYCYGIWCGQATKTFDALIRMGYPKDKLKWYRGGMQAWDTLGLTTIRTKN